MKKYILLMLAGMAFNSAHAAKYAVIVHADNPIKGSDEYLKNQARLFFLKQKTEWPDGKLAAPSTLPDDNEGFNVFRENVLGMSEDELNRHWIRLRQLSGVVPPREFRSNSMTIRHVARSPGAMGIAESLFVKNNPKVRVLFELGGNE